MELKSFIEQRGKERAEVVAAKAGTNYAYLSQIAYGHRKASPKLAQKIEEATVGEVTRQDLRPDIYGGFTGPVRRLRRNRKSAGTRNALT